MIKFYQNERIVYKFFNWLYLTLEIEQSILNMKQWWQFQIHFNSDIRRFYISFIIKHVLLFESNFFKLYFTMYPFEAHALYHFIFRKPFLHFFIYLAINKQLWICVSHSAKINLGCPSGKCNFSQIYLTFISVWFVHFQSIVWSSK